MSLLAPIYGLLNAISQRISEGRANNLDQINSTRMAKVDTLESRLSAARAGNLDLIDDIDADVTALLSRWSATRAAYLDEVRGDVNAVLTDTHEIQGDVNTLVALWNTTRAGYLDEVRGDVNNVLVDTNEIQGDVNTLVARLTATRAAKLDAIGGSVIKSIQRGQSYAGNVTISAVNTSKAFVSANLGMSSPEFIQVIAYLANSTRLTVSGSATVAWEVIEFY